jgi:hypothetical protein
MFYSRKVEETSPFDSAPVTQGSILLITLLINCGKKWANTSSTHSQKDNMKPRLNFIYSKSRGAQSEIENSHCISGTFSDYELTVACVGTLKNAGNKNRLEYNDEEMCKKRRSLLLTRPFSALLSSALPLLRVLLLSEKQRVHRAVP